MSHEVAKPYSPLYIKAWTLLTLVLGVVLFSFFLFGTTFIAAGKPAWDLIRWLASPFI